MHTPCAQKLLLGTLNYEITPMINLHGLVYVIKNKCQNASKSCHQVNSLLFVAYNCYHSINN